MPNDLTTILDNYFSKKIHKKTLDNGLTLVFKEDQSADVISIQLWVKTGSIHEDKFMGSGISHYLEHMLFKGTERRTYKQITDDVQNVGGSMNAYTTFDRTVYYIDGPTEATETAFDVISDITFNSQIDPEETTREQSVILKEIDMTLDEPDHQLHNNLFKTAFREHPYRYPVMGERNLFKKLTRDNLFCYYKTRYIPNNMVLVVVGNQPYEAILNLSEKYFGSFSSQPLPPVYIPEEPSQLSFREDHRTGDYKITRGSMVFEIPGHAHPDTTSLVVLAEILGHGQSSILWQDLRESQHLVHSVYASTWNPRTHGLFSIDYLCDPGKQTTVESAILETLEKTIKAPARPDQVAKAIRQAMVGEINIRKTMSGQAAQLGFSEAVLNALDYPRVFINNLQAVTPENLIKVHKKYLIRDKLSSLSLSPATQASGATKNSKKALPLPDFEEIQLKNGAKLLLQPYPNLPKVNIHTVFQGGPLYENPHQRGITGILATLLTKDTKRRTAKAVAEAIESVGGSFNEFTGNNSLGLSLEALSSDLPLVQEILHDALTQIKFTEEHLGIERDAQIAAIQEELDEILDYGIRKLRARFFETHPYSIPPLGTIEALEKITLQSIESQKNRLICPSNMVVSISGDFDKNALLDQLVPMLEELPSSSNFKPHSPKFPAPKPGYEQETLNKEQVVVLQAYPGVGALDPLFDVSEVVDELLSGMSSNLFTHVREEKGMAYYVGAARMVGIHGGMFYFYAGTSKKNYPQVFKEIQHEIQRIQSGDITDLEIERCKIRLKGGHRMGLQTPGTRAMKAALDCLFGLPTNSWRSYPDRIDQVTKEAVQQFAQKKFKCSHKISMAIGQV